MDGIPKEVDLPTYQRIMAEGEKLEKIGSFDKAIVAYSKALEAVAPNGPLDDPIGRNCLCARSSCYLHVGNHELALKDAEAALKDDKSFIKGIFAKAEALYFKGDFEFSLVFYHRGNKLRGELQEFRLGIQKAREAIINAVGSPEACPLEVPAETGFQRSMSASSKNTLKKPPRTQDAGRQTTRAPAPADRSVRQLLGELYADRQYLESLLSEPWAAGEENDMAQLVQGGISYLDTRTDFWRQQKPLYAREFEQKQRTLKKPLSRTVGSSAVGPSAVATAGAGTSGDDQVPFADIDTMLDDGEPREAIALATKWLPRARNPASRARLQCAIGEGHLDLDESAEASKAFSAALPDARKAADKTVLARALGGVGRTQARQGNHRDAIAVYEERLPATAEADRAWVLHEIGRSHLELGDGATALSFGEQARTAAASDQWRLNALLLVAQAHLLLKSSPAAIEAFETARELAQKKADDASLSTIDAALHQLRA